VKLPYTPTRRAVLKAVEAGEVHVVGGHPFRLGALMTSAERAVLDTYRAAGLIDVDRLTGKTSLTGAALNLLGHYDAHIVQTAADEAELREMTAW
jgi:hypothetical protein